MIKVHIVLSDDEVQAIVRDIEHANIDIKKTIEKAATAGYLAEDQAYCTVMETGDYTQFVSNVLGDNYPKIELDNFYFDIISKALDNEGIYMSLAYCNGDIRVPDAYVDETVEYDEYELEEDDLYYLREFALITADSTKVFRIYEEEGISGHKPTEDLGLLVKYDGEVYSYYFALRSVDLCGSSIRVFPLTWDLPLEHELSFKNPINRLIVEMINDVVVLKE